MSIIGVTNKLNQYASGHKISELQDVRKRLKSLKRMPTRDIFSGKSVFPKQQYAYHAGGIGELQFNVAWEDVDFLRYGVAFSLQPTRELPDPVARLYSKIQRFNDYYKKHQDRLGGLEFWYYSDARRSNTQRVKKITERIIRPNVFIFIGKHINTTYKNLVSEDYTKILDLFDELLPLYEYVEQDYDERIARLCWNTNGWRMPSGKIGKSKSAKLFEGEHGYGHEEWLLDVSKLVDGYHYGFIQGIHQNREKYQNSTFVLHLYSINADTHSRVWIGKISNVKIVGPKESRVVFQNYKNTGWHDEMKQQVNSVGLNHASFTKTPQNIFFNLKYKPSDLELLDVPVQFDAGDEAVSGNYYTTLENYKQQPSSIRIITDFSFQSGHASKSTQTGKKKKQKGAIIDFVHNRMQTAIYKQLVSKNGKNNVGTENNVGVGSKIDIVVRRDGQYLFYELKTGNSLKSCIREALGQLLEYACWPDQMLANKLIIVSPNAVTEEAKKYMHYHYCPVKLSNKFNWLSMLHASIL